jgi:hypothetical protein
VKWIILPITILLFVQPLRAQLIRGDTVISNSSETVTADTVLSQSDSKYLDSLRHRRIKRTILHSTFVPGWGQINNHQAWKVPLVAAAIGIPVLLFFNNLSEYKALRQAYIYRVDGDTSNDHLIPEKYQPISANSLKYYRDAYRQNVDYSALAFLIAWGLNVVDAAVYANLRDFDVSDKLSMKIKPSMQGYNRGSIALVFTFRDANKSVRQLIY